MSHRLTRNLVCLIVLIAPTLAVAQPAVDEAAGLAGRMPNGASFDPDKAAAPVRLIEGAGWKVGEDTVFHPVVGLETGAISNVFYTNSSNCANGQCVHA